MVEVVCSACHKIKDSTFDFYWRGDTRHKYCKECQKKYVKNWTAKHRQPIASQTKEKYA